MIRLKQVTFRTKPCCLSNKTVLLDIKYLLGGSVKNCSLSFVKQYEPLLTTTNRNRDAPGTNPTAPAVEAKNRDVASLLHQSSAVTDDASAPQTATAETRSPQAMASLEEEVAPEVVATHPSEKAPVDNQGFSFFRAGRRQVRFSAFQGARPQAYSGDSPYVKEMASLLSPKVLGGCPGFVYLASENGRTGATIGVGLLSSTIEKTVKEQTAVASGASCAGSHMYRPDTTTRNTGKKCSVSRAECRVLARRAGQHVSRGSLKKPAKPIGKAPAKNAPTVSKKRPASGDDTAQSKCTKVKPY